ncbi:MAG: hypothetical protein IJ200_06410 [Prevotella sp.]|nr:hypothetical protein [Prevotella sp.]
MDNLLLTDIKAGLPGITPVEGANLYENCVVELHRCGHSEQVILSLTGITTDTCKLIWEDAFNEQLDRTYADEQSVTERSAVCISVLLALSLTNYTVIERSRRGTGIDYMLGDKDDPLFMPKARLEISGIKRETVKNTVTTRYQQKQEQTSISDHTQLPAYISIVEFSTPKAIFNIKETIQ